MYFKTLGPLEITREDGPLPVTGFNQKAILGYLLLNAGKVVPTRQLITALWDHTPPSTARKMIQNGVSGLRSTLELGAEQQPVRLLTRSPGYVLQVPSQNIDSTRFEELTRLGRAKLAAGAAAEASAALREALALWRGPVMADLTEAGVRWPELDALQRARCLVYEDCVEAELTLGRHHELVGELAAAAAIEPTRERLCGQLMLALYRCGRQPDALLAYQRTRAALVEEFGLDPGAALQDLELRILRRDPGLNEPAAAPGFVGRPIASVDTAREAADRAEPQLSAVERALAAAPAAEPVSERVEATLVLVSLFPEADEAVDVDAVDSEEIDTVVRRVTRVLREEARRFGGTVRPTFNTQWLVVFGVPQMREDDPDRAVRMARAVHARLGALSARQRTPALLGGVLARIVVATDEVVATYEGYDAGQPTEITGRALWRCHRLLRAVEAGAVRVCDTTRSRIEQTFACPPGSRSESWVVRGVPAPRPRPRPHLPFTGRQSDVDRLESVFDTVLTQHRPQALTIVGEAGIGKTRLVAEFLRLVAEGDRLPVTRLAARTPPCGDDIAPSMLGGILRQYAGIDGAAPLPQAEEQFARALERVVADDVKRRWLLSMLRPCLDPQRTPVAPADRHQLALAWRRLVEEIAADRPLILVVEDLQCADEALLEIVVELAERAGQVPFLLLTTARPEVLHLRTGWRGGRHDAGTVNLGRLPDDAIRTLLGAHAPLGENGRFTGTRRPADSTDLVARIGGNPLFAQEFLKNRNADGTRSVLPRRIQSIVAARLDTLSLYERAVLRDAAVVGIRHWSGAVAAVGGHDRCEVAATLARLEAKGFLQSVRPGSIEGEQEYVFAQVVVHEVAYAQLTRRQRADKHWRATDWLAALPANRAGLLPYHFEQGVALGRHMEQSEETSRCLRQRARHALTQAGQRALAAGEHAAAALCLRSAIDLCPDQHPERRRLLSLYRQCHAALRSGLIASPLIPSTVGPSLANSAAPCQ